MTFLAPEPKDVLENISCQLFPDTDTFPQPDWKERNEPQEHRLKAQVSGIVLTNPRFCLILVQVGQELAVLQYSMLVAEDLNSGHNAVAARPSARPEVRHLLSDFRRQVLNEQHEVHKLVQLVQLQKLGVDPCIELNDPS